MPSDNLTPNSPAKLSPEEPPPTPLQVVANTGKRKSPAFNPKEMQIVPAVSLNEPFQLPDDWVVEVRPRGPNSSVLSDKYYHEPGTGRIFRSLISVRRYLYGEEEVVVPRKKPSTCLVPYQNSGSLRRVVYGGKLLRQDELEEAQYQKLEEIVPTTLQPKSSSLLPDGWIVEEIPRKCGFRCDRYFIEPGTGQKFRSVPEVQRYLSGERFRSKGRQLTLSNHTTAPRTPTPRKKNTSMKMLKDSIIDLMNPPEKVSWVFSGDGKDNWSPLLEECMLPDYVKEQWAETFLLGMNGWKHRVPQLTMGEGNKASNA